MTASSAQLTLVTDGAWRTGTFCQVANASKPRFNPLASRPICYNHNTTKGPEGPLVAFRLMVGETATPPPSAP